MTAPQLKKAPLKFALVEFQFSEVMEIAKYIPAFQDAIRKKFPLCANRKESVVIPQNNGVQIVELTRWSFLSANKASAIDVDQNRIVYCTSEYKNFAHFAQVCNESLAEFYKVVEPALLTKIGLRFGNSIKIDDHESLNALVDSCFEAPQYANPIGKVHWQKHESIIETQMGRMLVRTLYGENSNNCLPDATGLPINIQPDEKPTNRIILDIDHMYQAENEVFDVNQALEKLDSLHQAIDSCFIGITTKYARTEKWA